LCRVCLFKCPNYRPIDSIRGTSKGLMNTFVYMRLQLKEARGEVRTRRLKGFG
jgi:hypothetical protein